MDRERKRTSRSLKRKKRKSSPPPPFCSHQQDVDGKPQASLPPPAQPPTRSTGLSAAACLDKAGGYNSDDEYASVNSKTGKEWAERDLVLEKIISKKGWVIKEMCEDGACLFRAAADQVYGNQELHSILRNQCMDFIVSNKSFYKEFICENFDEYVARKRKDCVHGNHMELQALSGMLNRSIEVYSYDPEPLKIHNGLAEPDGKPIRMSYHRRSHYNSIVDSYQANIGVDPNPPSVTDGLVGSNLMIGADRQSEECAIEMSTPEEKTMANDEVLRKLAAQESAIQLLDDLERQLYKMKETQMVNFPGGMDECQLKNEKENETSPHKNCGSQTYSEEDKDDQASVSTAPDVVSPREPGPSQGNMDFSKSGYNFLNQVPLEVLGLMEWEDDPTDLAEALAKSQDEYLESFKKLTLKDSSGTGHEEPCVSPEGNKPSN